MEKEKTKTPEQEALPNPYNMNNYNIVQMVRKNFRIQGKKKWSTEDMRQEYFNIVVAKKLENQEWIDYYRELLENS